MILNLVPRSSLQSLLHLTRLSPYRYVWREDLKQGPHQVGRGKLGKTEFATLTKDCSPRKLGMGLHRTSCRQFIPFHTKPRASGCPEMALTLEGAWCHPFIKPQPGPEGLPLQKHTWTSIGRRRAHLPTPVWNVCCEKTNKCVCHEEEASAVPIRATLPFSKAPRAQHLGFPAPPQKCIWREMTSGEQSLKASLLSFQEGESSYQLFSTSWWPVLPLGAATESMIFALPLAIEGQDVLLVM